MSNTLSPPAGYASNDLVFDDRFGGGALNARSWIPYLTSAGAGGWPWNPNGAGGSGFGGHYDADYDMPGAVSVDNGLTLTAARRSVAGSDGGRPAIYPVTSGVVSSYGKLEFNGGYLQISMKEPGGNGDWPSLLLLPGSRARAGDDLEVDIQEGGMTGTGNPDQVFAYHIHQHGVAYGDQVNTGVDLTRGFNTYGIDWKPGKSIAWYLNGRFVAELTSADAPIPNEPMELVMANQVANGATADWHTTLDAATPASMPMQVAEVQLYQPRGGANPVLGANVGVAAAAAAAPAASPPDSTALSRLIAPPTAAAQPGAPDAPSGAGADPGRALADHLSAPLAAPSAWDARAAAAEGHPLSVTLAAPRV